MHIRAMKESGLTAADEMLYPENRSYLDDILSYEAIGARSVENQQHRLTASGMDIPVGMKKNRPGILLTCMCRQEQEEIMTGLLFKHTTTLGIREHVSRRFTLTREIKEIETPYGTVREKISSGYGITRSKLEYEDVAKIAHQQGMSLEEVKDAVRRL